MIAPLHRRAAATLALLLAGGLARASDAPCVPALVAAAATGPAAVPAGVPAAGLPGADATVAAPALPAGAVPPGLPPLPASDGGLRISPDTAIEWSSLGWSTDTLTGDTQLQGDVHVRLGDRELRSDRLDYRAASQELRLAGTVQYLDPTLHLSGDAGRYGGGLAEFDHAQFELLRHPGRGSAARITLPSPEQVELDEVAYTTCAPGTADWQLRARRITLDLKTLRGLGRDTRVEFKGVPIFYLPVLSFPISDARQSGFLFPSVGSSSQGGAMLAVPWYWNLAPNQDLTLTPKVYTRRGLDLDADYRLLERAGSGSLSVNFLPSDRVAHGDRSWERLLLDARLPAGWQAHVHAENASDQHYLEDFSEGALTTSAIFLQRQLQFGYRSDAVRLGAELLQFQTLDEQLARSDRPYAELPRLTGSGQWSSRGGLQASYEAELVNFWRAFDPAATATENQAGWRGHLQPALSLDYSQPGWYLRPRAGFDLTSYRLRDTGSGATSVNRNLPVLSLDSGLQLERSDAARVFTLEPRLYYVYIPYRDQSQLPDFDAGLPDPNFVSLFRANRYAGIDRIGDANNLTVGLTTRMLASSTGQRYLSATIGESLHFQAACPLRTLASGLVQPQCVLLPGETPDTRRRSDLILNADLTAYRNWSLRYDLAWNPAQSQTEKALLMLQYRPSGTKVANLGYRYTRGSGAPGQASGGWVDQAEASLAWPVAGRWDLYARSVYALGSSASYTVVATVNGQQVSSQVSTHSLENFAGFHYRGSCWGLTVVARDTVSRSAGTRDRGWFLQLELNGLSSVGSGADSFLRGAIRGYSPATPNR